MLLPSGYRYHPRGPQDRDRDRREAALRAQVSELTDRIHALEKEQRVQFTRIAELQRQLDEAVKLIKSAGQGR